MMRWHVVYTGPGGEATAKRALEAAGYETFFPSYMVRARIRNGRRFIATEKPLFPRYIFLGLLNGQGLYVAANTIGVQSILSGPDGPEEVSASAINEIRARCAAESKQAAQEPKNPGHRPPKIPEGSQINIIDGPLKGLPGQVERDDGKSPHIEISLSILGRVMRVPVEAAAVR